MCVCVYMYNLPAQIALCLALYVRVLNITRRQQMVAVWQKLFYKGRLMAVDNCNPDYVMVGVQNVYTFHAVTCVQSVQTPEHP